MTYPETVKYLDSFANYEKNTAYSYEWSFKLKRFQKFLKLIDNPQSKLNAIHIAGSKGKGSVCAFIAYILKESGFKVGLYTSPHLSDFRERIRILNPKSKNQNKFQILNPKQILLRHAQDPSPSLRSGSLEGSRAIAREKDPEWSRGANPKSQIQKLDDFEGMISKKEFCDLVKKLKPRIDKFNKISQYDDLTRSTSLRVNPEPVEGLTFFEVYTALAFQYFKDQKADFVVLETGLGGRLDATNTCNSLLSVITPISLEHTYLLGKTLKDIAFEKAAIIKRQNKKTEQGKILALTSKQDKFAMVVIEKVSKNNNAILFRQGRDFKFNKIKNNSFDYSGLNYKLNNLKIGLLGSHQLANASLAIASIEALRYYNIVVGEEAIRRGIRNCFWPARFEIVSENPLIILDGAQNSASIRVLRKAVKENFPDKKILVIFGISKDKELKDTCREAEKINGKIILTKADNPRAAEPRDLLRYFSNNSMILTSKAKDALDIAKAKAGKKDLILVTGSLFVCAELRELLKK